MTSKLIAALRAWLTVLAAVCAPELFACQSVLAQSTVSLAPTASPAAGQPGVTSISVLASNLPAGSIPPANVTINLRPQIPVQALLLQLPPAPLLSSPEAADELFS